MSAVNLAEFASKCSDQGMARADVEIVLGGFELEIAAFAADLGSLPGRRCSRPPSRPLAGDRACLALAQKLRATARTADRAWVGLDLGIAMECVR